MSVAICWRADATGAYQWLHGVPPATTVVVFDAAAERQLRDRGYHPRWFDDLLSWEERSALEHEVDAILQRLADDSAVERLRIGAYPISAFAEYELRSELNNVLRGWAIIRHLDASGAVTVDPGCPSGLIEGALAAGADVTRHARWLPAGIVHGRAARRDHMTAWLARAVGSLSPSRRSRVAVIPTLKAGVALEGMPTSLLRSAGVAVMPFPWLDHGNAVKISLRRGLPLLPTFPSSAGGRVEFGLLPAGLRLHDDAALDGGLRHAVDETYRLEAPRLSRCLLALRGADAAPRLRAVVLPTTAVGPGRVVRDWAVARGITAVAVQHGVYGFQRFDGGDRRADVLLSWGPAVAQQMRVWPDPRPEFVPVGAPGVPQRARHPTARGLRRVLITTTWADGRSMVGPFRLSERFVEVIAGGVRQLLGAGLEVVLRIHPAESATSYDALLAELGLEVPYDNSESLPAALERCDLAVSSVSSAAFEAAALGVPVLLWVGDAPRWIADEHLVAPWNERRPGMFSIEADFDGLGALGAQRPNELLAEALDLAHHLRRYVEPFDVERFAVTLRRLAE